VAATVALIERLSIASPWSFPLEFESTQRNPKRDPAAMESPERVEATDRVLALPSSAASPAAQCALGRSSCAKAIGIATVRIARARRIGTVGGATCAQFGNLETGGKHVACPRRSQRIEILHITRRRQHKRRQWRGTRSMRGRRHHQERGCPKAERIIMTKILWRRLRCSGGDQRAALGRAQCETGKAEAAHEHRP
jgi:hypothetical protein